MSPSKTGRTPAATAVAARIELRVYLPIAGLQRQFAAYLAVPTRARGYPPTEGDHALIVEIAPGLAIERVTDLALRAEPAVEPGILFVERHFGVLEVHSRGEEHVRRAGQAILDGIGRSASDQQRPRLLYSDVIEDITDQQAIIINRSRQASMIMPGQSLLVCEMAPALFAAVAANEAERAAPENTLVDVAMIGASGRLYIAGTTEGVGRAAAEIERLLAGIEGREAVSADGVVSPEEILRGYDPFAQAALEPFGFSAQARLALLSLSENATYRVDDPRTGAPRCCGCTGPATTRRARSPPSWPGSRRCAGTRGCSPPRCTRRRTAGRWSTSPSAR